MPDNLQRKDFIKLYYELGLTYKEIVYVLAQNHGYIISERHLKRILKELKLSRRRYNSLEDIVRFIQQEMQGSGRLHGYRIMYTKCLQEGLKVKKEDVRLIMQELDPEGTNIRRRHRLVRRRYYAKGPNFIWHLDGYDKLKPYGLCISGCIDGYSRKIIWLNVYNTNNNPSLIGSYYLESIKECGGCPRIVRGDFGTENGKVCAFQQYLRRNHEDSLSSKSFMYGCSTTNQRIESWWGFLRKECMQYWMDLFRGLIESGDFGGDFVDRNLVQFCFMALVQAELDTVANIWNTHIIRPSSNDRVPSGRPEVMYYFPGMYGTNDQLCDISQEDFETCTEEAIFRSVIQCDQDIYDLCIIIMEEENLDIPIDAEYAKDLYLLLREKINILMRNG